MEKKGKIRLVQLAALLISVPMAFTIPVTAAETVNIKDISISQTESGRGTVTVRVYNPLPEDEDFTLLLKKNDAPTVSPDNVYALYDRYEAKKVANGELEFVIDIPDARMSGGVPIPSEGEYALTFRNGAGEKAESTFQYASAAAIAAFIREVNETISTVTDPDAAYEALKDVICADHHAEMFAVGADFDTFKEHTEKYGAEMGNRVLNHMYRYGKKAAITADNFPDAFYTALAMEIFYRENKKLDPELLAVSYGDTPMDTSLYPEVQKLMKSSYTDVFDFQKELRRAYGIVCVNHATMMDVENALDDFLLATGDCTAEINAIRGLSLADRYKAYEHIVTKKKNTQLTTLSGLQALLKDAYRAANSPGGSGGSGSSGSSGGGSYGSADNRTSPSGSALSPSVTVERTPEESGMVFTDLPQSHWAAESVIYLKNKNIVSGTDTGAFEPDRYVTREEFTKMLVLAFGIGTDADAATFEDVAADAWYRPYIGAAVRCGIVRGIDNSRFGVGQRISRQDMAVMVERAAENAGIAFTPVKDYTEFADANEIADYAKDAVQKLTAAGILNGKGENRFDPTAGATRAEAAKIIFGAMGGK